MPGFGELLVILAIVLVIFGAKRVPEIFEALGKGVRNFRRATREDDTVQVTGRVEPSPGLPEATQPSAGAPQDAKVRVEEAQPAPNGKAPGDQGGSSEKQ